MTALSRFAKSAAARYVLAGVGIYGGLHAIPSPSPSPVTAEMRQIDKNVAYLKGMANAGSAEYAIAMREMGIDPVRVSSVRGSLENRREELLSVQDVLQAAVKARRLGDDMTNDIALRIENVIADLRSEQPLEIIGVSRP